MIGQLAFLAFIIASVAAENRVPFDILEAESELVAGFRVEYSGMKFALIQLGEYAHMLGTSFLGALLFLGAWSGPGPEWLGPVWFLLKALFGLPADHLGALELHPHSRRSDSADFVEAAAAARRSLLVMATAVRSCVVERTVADARPKGFLRRSRGNWSSAVVRAMRMTFVNFVPQAGHRPLSGQAARHIPIAIAACWRWSTTRTPARKPASAAGCVSSSARRR